MSNDIGISAAVASLGDSANSTFSAGSAASAAGLQAQINRYLSQLNDWVTCVSATTPKGKAEIQSLSGKIAAIKEQIARLEAGKSRAATHSPTDSKPAPTPTASAARHPGSIDVWA